jgi:hypothetical protein
MHIATSGQSGQFLFFCPSGQHGMSPDIAAMSLISLTDSRFAAAGDTSGATTSPAITKTASKRPMSRRRFMSQHHTAGATWEGRSFHIVARLQHEPEKRRKHKWLTCDTSASADTFRADKVHKRLPATRPEENNVIPLGCTSLHSGRPGGHAGNRQSDGGGSLFQKTPHGRRRNVSLQHVPTDLGGVASREICWHA